MSLESVKAFLAANAPDIGIIESEEITPTVATAAQVHGVGRGHAAAHDNPLVFEALGFQTQYLLNPFVRKRNRTFT